MASNPNDPREPFYRVSRVGESSGVEVPGAPVRFQVRFALEPVGQDWDGTYKPLTQPGEKSDGN